MIKRFNIWLAKYEGYSRLGEIIWNMAGAGVTAAQSAIILVFVASRYELKMAGVVTIAYAIGNLFMTIAKYGIRNYQVTDQSGEVRFSDYFWCRVITVGAVAAVAGLFVYLQMVRGVYAAGKCLIVMEIIFLKLTDSFEDVFLGRYQQLGHFIVAAKVMAVRQIIVTGAICGMIVLGSTIGCALGVGIVLSICIMYCLLRITYSQMDGSGLCTGSGTALRGLLIKCFPLCVGSSLAIYAGNIPKYAIDALLDEDRQAVFGYLMLPVFVVTLLSQFIYQPFVKELGDFWHEGRLAKMRRTILKQCITVLLLSAVVLVAGLSAGLPLLSLMYKVELTQYGYEFVILLIGGSMYTLAFYLTIPITAIRKQRIIALGYGFVSVLAVVFQKKFVLGLGMIGAAWLYLGINLILTVIYSMVLTRNLCMGKEKID